MGVIKNEGLKQSVVTYIGVLIGALNTLYFYPKYLNPEELGLFRFLIDTATLIFPFISLGIHNLSIRMFPTFKNKATGHNGLLFFLMSGVLIGYAIFLILFLFFEPFFLSFLADKSELIQQYWYYIIPISGLFILSAICNQYILNFKKVLLPTIFHDLYIKVGLPLIAAGYYFDVFSLSTGVYILVSIYIFQLSSYLIYIYWIKEWYWKPNWNFLNRALLKDMGVYAFYGTLGSIGSILATRIDIFMVAMLATNDLKDVGIYSIAMFIANIITVPARAITNVSSPVIATAWRDNDMENIEDIYKKSSIVLLTLGLLFLIGVWCSVDDLFQIMPNGEKFIPGKYVILILGIGKLFDLATGVNDQIISYSKYFRFNFYAVLILAVFNIISNYIFIPIYQINGAAIATMSSLIIYNLSKYIFIYYRIKIQPFSRATLKVLAIGAVTLLAGLNVPEMGIPIVDIAIRSTIILGLFLGPVLYLQISPDLNTLTGQIWNRVKKIIS